jgi:hypothetical protein
VGEESFVRDSVETVRIASEQFGRPLYLLGESLGCGVAAAVSSRTSVKIDGMILITPWDTLAAVAQKKFPFIPVRLFLSDRYDSIGNLRSFGGPIAVVGAGQDTIVPMSHAVALYESLKTGRKRMWTLQKAGHNDWPDFVDAAWWRELMAHMDGTAGG